jgi:hypothetical protein
MMMKYMLCPLQSSRQPSQGAIARFQCPIYVYEMSVNVGR